MGELGEKTRRTLELLAVAGTLAVLPAPHAGAAAPPAAPPAPPPAVRQLPVASRPWTGDLAGMIERRRVRVLVPYSRTLYYNDKGRERGLTADAAREFEQYLNQKHETGKRPITILLIPTTRDRLLPDLARGLGDIAAGNLTVTSARLRTADFVVQSGHTVKEIVVAGANAPAIRSLADLRGKTVHVRRASSYYEHLATFNLRNRQLGVPVADLQLVPDALEDEDMLEMANAGVIDFLVVDDWKAEVWAQVLPRVTLYDNLSFHAGGRIGWAIRKDSPQLAAAIQDYYDTFARQRASHAYRLGQATKRIKQMTDPTRAADWQRFERTLALFRQYGQRYSFDPIMLAAQGYQESQLDQAARSHVGAIGVMQIMPATGAEMKVGDIKVLESNIHAGAKYMDILMTQFFKDAKFSEADRSLFAFASYNAGPGRISSLRRLAAERGLDPDQWFNNVELVVAEKVGIETTTYVRNIYKYYVSYTLTLAAQEAGRRARRQVAPAAGTPAPTPGPRSR